MMIAFSLLCMYKLQPAYPLNKTRTCQGAKFGWWKINLGHSQWSCLGNSMQNVASKLFINVNITSGILHEFLINVNYNTTFVTKAKLKSKALSLFAKSPSINISLFLHASTLNLQILSL